MSGGGNSGLFIGDSTAGSGGDINTGSLQSFGLFGHTGETSTATRSFSAGALGIGDSFSLQLGVNFRNGFKGLNLRDGGGSNLFTFNVTGNDYTYTDDANTGSQTSLGLAYQADSVFTLTFLQSAASTLNVDINRTSSDPGSPEIFNQDFTTSGAAQFHLFVGGTDDGSSQNNLYANNLSLNVVPEPGTFALFLLGSVLMRGIRRRS